MKYNYTLLFSLAIHKFRPLHEFQCFGIFVRVKKNSKKNKTVENKNK